VFIVNFVMIPERLKYLLLVGTYFTKTRVPQVRPDKPRAVSPTFPECCRLFGLPN